MAYTQTDADALKEAIATGALDVQYADGSRVTYRSLADMRTILGMIEAEVAAASGAPKTFRAFRGSPRSGY